MLPITEAMLVLELDQFDERLSGDPLVVQKELAKAVQYLAGYRPQASSQ